MKRRTRQPKEGADGRGRSHPHEGRPAGSQQPIAAILETWSKYSMGLSEGLLRDHKRQRTATSWQN